MDVQKYLTVQEYLLAADRLKEGRSVDYIEGFGAGVDWLQGYYELELLGCRKSQSPNSEEE